MKEPQRIVIAHTNNTSHTYNILAFHLPICVTTLAPFILNILRASERAASLYTPVLYFLFSLQRVLPIESHGSGNRNLFQYLHIPLAAAAAAAMVVVLIWRLCFGRVDVISSWLLCFSARNGCEGVMQERKHRTVGTFHFAYNSVEERILCKRWDGRNSTCGIVRSKGSIYYTILGELS